MQRRIVVPLDGSVFAEQALRHGQQLASEMSASRLPPPWCQARDWGRVAGRLTLPIGNVEMSVVDEAAQSVLLVHTEAVGRRGRKGRVKRWQAG